MLGSPLAGESLDEVLDATPALQEIIRRYIGNPEYANLPRKYKTAVSGLQDVAHEINDVSFIGCGTPNTGRAWTCGWAAGCRQTRCWPSGSVPGCRSTRCPTCGKR
ncbi:nitrite and sulphite reductase 4Fe-4S domain protein [Mycobacterium xenopi 3993]|nr:nitrite and sulphite reductase 4Fe-4S domain protein [Mycobacterium xenopi 3993]